MTTCPHCSGFGGFGLLRKRFESFIIDCETCQGKGEVSDEKLIWIKRGRAIRDRRVDSGETMRDFAKRHKLDVMTVSRAELGVIDPSVLEELK